LVARREVIAAELRALGSHEQRQKEAQAALEAARVRAHKTAEALSKARAKAARTLATRVEEALGELSMKGARLKVELGPLAGREGDEPAFLYDNKRLSATGFDRAEFQLQANPGEEARPLHRVASGGELSRIMLALKKILSRADQVATYVF